jgi:hypothetical protein
VPYFDHPELPSAPPEQSVLWRYLCLAELGDLLKNKTLHLNRADQLQDASIDVEGQVNLSAASGMSPQSIRRALALMQSVQSAVFVDSWYENDSSKHDQWIAGGRLNEEIAIRSNMCAIKSAFARAPQKIYASSVQYIDLASHPIPVGNVFLPALHKRYELHEEKEVRILLLQTSGEKTFSPGPAEGLNITVDRKSLIHAIHVPAKSSDSLCRHVMSLADQYGLTCETSPQS